MIRKFSFTIKNIIFAYLPPYKRRPNRLKLLGVLLYPLTIIMQEYKAWRDEAIIKATVTIEKGSIEWYLNYLFDPVEQRIYIETNNAEGVLMGLRATEVLDFQLMGLRATEPTDFVAFSNRGEHPVLGFASFGVFIPTDLAAQADAISGVMRIYKLGGKTFKIIQY